MKSLLVAAVLCLNIQGFCQDGTGHLLYDFEQSWQYEEWQTGEPQTQRCFPSSKFAVSGTHSLGFISQSSSRKPQLQVLVWDNDWEPFEYVSMVITNPTSQRIPMTCGIANENGSSTFLTLEPMTSRTYVVRLRFPAFARKDNILTLSLCALEEMDAEFYVDQVQLHKEGREPKAEQGKGKKKDVTAVPVPEIDQQLKALLVDELQANCQAIGGYFDSLGLDMPPARTCLVGRGESLMKQVNDESLTHDQRVLLLLESEQLKLAADRFKQIQEARGDTDAGPAPFLVGSSDSMTKVMPRDVWTDLDFEKEVTLSLAGNEKESVQLAVVPMAADLRDVRVTSSDLKGDDGHVIGAGQVECDLVAFVKTTNVSDNHPRYIGWYPEPLIRNPDAVDVRVGDIQTWWVRVRTQENQPAGLYRGTLTVSSRRNEPVTLALNVKVYDFNLPQTAPIPTAITYDAWKHPTIGGEKSEAWNSKLKYVHADFLADYMMNMDSLYRDRRELLDWELLKYCADKGQLSAINLGYFYDDGDNSVKLFQENYEKAKALGLLKYCYIYGFDEQPRWSYPAIESAARKFKKLYPEVLVMTTAQDHSYGFDGELETLTAWCPIINRYNPTLAEKARREGRRVWWYTCNWPKAPYPNVYIDYSAVEIRVLTGLMHAKYQPDGFLYYHTSIFSKENAQGITTYPWTNWEPWNFVSTNGDGALFCIDENGYPVATVRAENYRDGFEDLAYYMILEYQVKQYKASSGSQDDEWLRKAQDLLARPDRYVPTRYRFTRDPKVIRGYREELAAHIERSPIRDKNPWKNGLGIWGLDR